MIRNVKKFPKNSGVYFFRDQHGRILYIGKAANLKDRLRSYSGLAVKDVRISKMLEAAKSVDWQETDSEIEALILESQLIKKYRPPFNIVLRDDKQYFYVIFTKETFPKVTIVHRPPDKNFIGPFTDGTALRVTLKLLRRIFPYCTCKQKHNNYCLNYHIGNCSGFCCLKNPNLTKKQISAYKKNIRAIKDILNGKRITLVKKLEKQMTQRGKQNRFEEAIGLRTQIEKLKQVFENARVIQKLGTITSVVLKQLKQVLNLPMMPVRIEGYDVSNIQGVFATGAMAVFIDGRPDKNEYRKFKIRRILPSEASRKGGYGDTQMLAEILHRRFNHPEWPYPDLILIDGGKGQLSAARTVISNEIPIIALTKNEKHIGDHILSTTGKTAIKIKKLPPAVRNLILQIDAEAHRFAISYYRKLHRKSGI